MSEEDLHGDSRRSFMKKGTLAATALAAGAGATATATAQEDDEEDDDMDNGEEGEVVVTGQDYYPDVNADVIAELESGTRDTVLEGLNEEQFDDIGDWDVYIVQFDVGAGTVLGHIFVDEDDAEVAEGDSVTMTGDASFLDTELNLLEVDVSVEEGEPEEDDEVDDEEDDEVDDEEDDEVDDEEPDDEVDDEEPDDEMDDEEPDDEEPDNEEDDDGLF
ncbi:calcium-binding protein [Natronobacterium texcoconense]|nr:calcium-binding protein [Natronobacterium texcoconense]